MSNFTYERNFPSKSGCSSAQSRTLDQSSRGQTCRLYEFSANIYVVALATEKLARPDPVQQTPEILKTVAVDGSSDILYRMFCPLLSESRVQALVKFQYIVKVFGTRLNLGANEIVKRLSFATVNKRRSYVAVPLVSTHDSLSCRRRLSWLSLVSHVLVQVTCLAAAKTLISCHLTRHFVKIPDCIARPMRRGISDVVLCIAPNAGA